MYKYNRNKAIVKKNYADDLDWLATISNLYLPILCNYACNTNNRKKVYPNDVSVSKNYRKKTDVYTANASKVF